MRENDTRTSRLLVLLTHIRRLIQKRTERTRTFIGRWVRGLNLFSAVALTLLGLLFFAALMWFVVGFATIGGFTWEISSTGINRAQATGIALTMVGGAGAAVALVVTYRRHSQVEGSAFLERLGAAAAQLGDEKATVQLSGVYALAALADESNSTRRQQVIDVLCGYIRLPYDTAISGQAGHQARTETTTYPADDKGVGRETTVTIAHKSGEKQIRATIFGVIRDHVRSDSVNSWSEMSFNFRGAVIDSCDLNRAQFRGNVDFSFVKFVGITTFTGAEFHHVTFEYADFYQGVVEFRLAIFSNLAIFNKAQFSGASAGFSGAKFLEGSTSFNAAAFIGSSVSFHNAQFIGSSVGFRHAHFSGGSVSFHKAHFESGSVDFEFSSFVGTKMRFTGCKFSGSLVQFGNPQAWDSPPMVPWRSGGEIPAGIQPRAWPPQVSQTPF